MKSFGDNANFLSLFLLLLYSSAIVPNVKKKNIPMNLFKKKIKWTPVQTVRRKAKNKVDKS